ncbi:MAG: serine hydrolase domain-containing protein [Candidatus Acidiferrum sp.]|jgi:CubicO group peptidase (beta-lactamase class C family)
MINTVGRRVLVISCVCAIACVNTLGLPTRDLTPDQIASIDHYVTAEMEREYIPGVAIGVYSRGQILVAKGYGLANVELDVAVKPETIFQSGSVGKQFVSAAIMMLVEGGKIALDDSIVKYFPNAPKSWQAIRVKNLLSHTSGLAEYESDERTGPKGPFYTRLDFTEDELVEKVESLPIEFKPGDKWDYRNTNYLLLGVMIHKVTGSFYADYLQQRIFTPLGMKSTRLISEADIIPNRASGYELNGDKLQNQSWVSPTFNSTADGALYFNVLDLAKWDAALYETKLLKQSSMDQMWTVFLLNDGKPNLANYGFAWRINSISGHKVIEHGGSWQGFRCHISRYVDDGITVVVLTNLDSALPNQFAHVVAGLVDPALAPPKLSAIVDKQPELAVRLGALLDKIVAGKDVRDQMTPARAAILTPDATRFFAQTVRLIWPSESQTLVSRTETNGVTVSSYRIIKNNESRIVTFGLGTDGKIADFGIRPDPDVR